MTRASLRATVAIVTESLAAQIFNADVTVADELPASSYSPYMIIAIPVRMHVKLSTIVRWPIKRRPNTATEAVTAVVKVEDVLDDKAAVE